MRTFPKSRSCDALDWEEDSKRLPDVVIEAKVPNRVDEDLVHLAQHLQLVPLGHVSQHPHR